MLYIGLWGKGLADLWGRNTVNGKLVRNTRWKTKNWARTAQDLENAGSASLSDNDVRDWGLGWTLEK